MKTIEEKALESANENFGLVEDMNWDMNKEFHNYHKEAFKEGVEFAQRWIDVDDELPECNIKGEDDVMLSETVLIKVKNNNDMPVVAIYIKVDDDEFFETLGVKVQQKRITHWRPIELK